MTSRMEKEKFLRGGEYAPPQLELLEFAVELGFATSSWGDGSLGDYDNELGYDSEYYY